MGDKYNNSNSNNNTVEFFHCMICDTVFFGRLTGREGPAYSLNLISFDFYL